MDHDKQVTDLVQVTRDRFLNQPLNPDERDKDTFDLEKEFAKSAKNRSLMIPLAVAAFLVVLGVGAWLASQFTDEASQKSSVSIGSFEDLKLKEIFDTARKNKQDLEAVQLQIDQLTQASNDKVAAIQQAGNSKADVAAVDDPTGSLVKNIQDDTARQIAAQKASLAASLRPLKAQADAIQKKIDSYDDRIGQMNKKNQQVLDSQQRLFELEKQKLTSEYEARLQAQAADETATVARLKTERDTLVSALKAKQASDIRKLILKYNPMIQDPVLSPLMTAAAVQPAAYPALDQFPDRIASRNLISADLQTSLAARVDRVHALLARLQQIPYENSVPPMLSALDHAIADSLTGYDGYLAPLAAHMTDLDGVIAQMQTNIDGLNADKAAAADAKAKEDAWLARWTGSVDSYVATLRDYDGVFTDVRVPDDFLVVLKPDSAKSLQAAIDAAAATPPAVAPAKQPAPVDLALIRDGLNNNELGTVSLQSAPDGVWRAKLVKQNDPKRPFKAFDRLVLQLPKKKTGFFGN